MSGGQRLDGYLEAAGGRLRWRGRVVALAALVAAVGLVSVAGGALVATLVPAADHLAWIRIALYGLVCAGLFAAWRRRAGTAAVAARVEHAVPAFDGRLATWWDSGRQPRAGLRVLLEREAWRIAEDHPPARLVPAWQLGAPAVAATLMAGAVVWWMSGSAPWQLGALRLWTGDVLVDARPHISVEPGDVVVRAGSDVVIRGQARGFRATGMELSVAFGGSTWEQAPMAEDTEGAFGFVLVGVSESVEYFIGARGLNSARHRITVADLPTVTQVETRLIYPAWTGLPPARRNDGDVAAVAGTRVSLRARTDRPVREARLMVNGAPLPLAVETLQAADSGDLELVGEFEVTGPGEWHIEVPTEGALARISDHHLIEVIEDQAPEVAYRWPGHDRQATAIEELTLEFEASDDFGIEAMSLHYAVNGGAWTEVALAPDAPGHLLALESVRTGAGAEARALAPGDVVTLFAEARDHAGSARTPLYFVDVRPFETSYRESQQTGGQGGSEGGGFDIAERQRDILSATWNLINDRDRSRNRGAGPGTDGSDTPGGAFADQAEMLEVLQNTLREQVETLIERAGARGLGADADVGDFVQALTRAVAPMNTAAAQLAEQHLEAAVGAEQQALAHLVSAESSVRDVNVSLSRGGGRGTSGRSLAELVDLEMDQARNRYELPQQPDAADGPGAEDPAWRQLEELAARQEELARRSGQDAQSLASRWQQARLQRELEELRDSLERRRQASGPQDGATRAGGGALERALGDVDQALERLEQAAGNPGADDSAASRATQQAGSALRRAADALRDGARNQLDERLAQAGRRVSNLQRDQDRVLEALDNLQRDALRRARDGEGGLARSDYGMHTFADVKRRMQQDVTDLRAELTDLSAAISAADPDASRQLDRALSELDDARVDERLAAAAEAFEYGQPLYVIGSESLVEQALRRLGLRVSQAQEAMRAQGQSQDMAGSAVDGDPLLEVRALRRRLEAAGSAAGGYQASEVEAVARAAGRLQQESVAERGSDDAGAAPASLGDYHIRGTDDANTEALYRLTAEQLDLLEATIQQLDRLPVRAQAPRSEARDSEAAARYFRELSQSGRGS